VNVSQSKLLTVTWSISQTLKSDAHSAQFSALLKSDKFSALVKSDKTDKFSALVKSDW
jgi:hypothetical protein